MHASLSRNYSVTRIALIDKRQVCPFEAAMVTCVEDVVADVIYFRDVL